jgi:Flp pilus assembly protein TadD/mono/diheme cytochrome c family protein
MFHFAMTRKRIISSSVIVFAIACAFMPAAQTQSSSAAQPTFSQHIAPLMFEYCAACHHPGGSGPFSLMTYSEVRQRARQIAVVTRSRYMPPWLPEPGPYKFTGERRLSDDQISTIQRWIEAGMPAGDPARGPRAPQFPAGWQLGQPDLIVKMSEAFTVPAEGTDVFRNFVLPIPVTATKFVKAVEILPGNKQVVHHANILIDRTGGSRRLDAKDPGPGFGGMEVTIESESFDPDSHFLFWKPGTVPWIEPDGMAWRCDPGTDLVLNMHLQPSGKPERIQAEIGLYFSAQPQTIFPMLLQLERDGALDIPPGKKNFVVTDEFTLPVDVDLLGVYPHAHYLGKELQGLATLPDGAKKTLINITRWDLNWQAVYKYEQPVFLPKGTVISLRFSYDNSADNERNPNRPPRRVVAGNRSADEMSHLWLQALPRTESDGRAILQEALMRHRLKKYPADFTAHFNLGAVLQARGKNDEAIIHFKQALQASPNSYLALTNLGAAYQETGRAQEAINFYRQALRLRPDYLNARYNLGNLLLSAGKIEEAITHFREALRAHPDDAGAHNSLGSALALQGKLTEAAHHFEESLRHDPDNPDVWGNLGSVLIQQGRLSEATRRYEQALRLSPENADLHNELGVLLAQQRRIPEAITHFEQAVRLNPHHPQARENLRRARAQSR